MKNKNGFSIIEIVVALAIIALLATIIVPNFVGVKPWYVRKQFVAQLNALLLFARQHAIVTNKIQKVDFDFGERKVRLFSEIEKEKGKLEFKLVTSSYINPMVEIPDSLEIKNFYIAGSGFDEMTKFAGTRAKGGVWFYLVPEGISQEVIINILDSKDVMFNGKPRPIGLVLNPFTAQFKEYDTFQK
jgi:prepilin-type N-terminal cleavage/methylation domain-containing protein